MQLYKIEVNDNNVSCCYKNPLNSFILRSLRFSFEINTSNVNILKEIRTIEVEA